MGETPRSSQLLVGSSSSASSMGPGGRRRPNDLSYLRKVQFWLIRCQPFTGGGGGGGDQRSGAGCRHGPALEAAQIRSLGDDEEKFKQSGIRVSKVQCGDVEPHCDGSNSAVPQDIEPLDDDSSVDTTMYIMSNRNRQPVAGRTHRRPTNLLKQCWLVQSNVRRCSPPPSTGAAAAAADTAEAEAASAGAAVRGATDGTGQVAEVSSTQPAIGVTVARRGRKRKQPISCSQRNARRRKVQRRMSSSSSSSSSAAAASN